MTEQTQERINQPGQAKLRKDRELASFLDTALVAFIRSVAAIPDDHPDKAAATKFLQVASLVFLEPLGSLAYAHPDGAAAAKFLDLMPKVKKCTTLKEGDRVSGWCVTVLTHELDFSKDIYGEMTEFVYFDEEGELYSWQRIDWGKLEPEKSEVTLDTAPPKKPGLHYPPGKSTKNKRGGFKTRGKR